MRIRHLLIVGSIFPVLFSIVLFFGVLISADSDDGGNSFSPPITGMNLSAEVLKHQPMVEKYARENGISEYVNVLLAIIQVESGGTAKDVMQSSESLGLPGGKKVTYTNPIAIERNGGWRYAYGNMFYAELVNQYLTVAHFDDETVQAIMNEALKYQGWKYVYGGSNPNTSFDCSGLTQWCFGKAGITLPRTAQAQYDATQHIPLSQAKAGDLVFFHSTYNAGSYVTHVGIYVGNNQMYHAGDPIGYADLNNSYWQQHLIGAGRIRQ